MATLAWSERGQSTTARAVSLDELVQHSTRIARSTPLDSFARSEVVGGTRHIVTYSRLRVDELIHGPSESELMVRTLGGQVGELGEIVHGEAVLALNEECLVFLRTNADGIEQVAEMAQGHYALHKDAGGTPRLLPSRNMPRLIGDARSAVSQLAGTPFPAARSLILGVRR